MEAAAGLKTRAPIGIVGGGLMGAGIAAKFATAGHAVIVQEPSAERRAALSTVVDGILGELQEAGQLDATEAKNTAARVRVVAALSELRSVDWVIEAIPEVLESKLSLYRELEQIVPASTVIASNTSGFMPDALAAALKHPERFVVLHFWNPPHAIPLVEVVPGTRTETKLAERAADLLRDIGSEPVVLRKAVPGFIGNRLQFAILREALHLVHSGVADPETIDAVVKASLGRRYGIMGPLESADLGGLETMQKIAKHLGPQLAHDDEGALKALGAKVDRGEKGAASGQGFYPWTEGRRAAIRKARIAKLLRAD